MEDPALDAAFAALADPTRRAILARLAQGEATAGELAAPFPISQPAISRHLRVLADAGLIERGRDAQRRPCRLAPDRVAEVQDWLEALAALWRERFDRLDALLAAMPDAEHDPARPPEPAGAPAHAGKDDA